MQLFVAIICIVAALVVGGVVGVFTGIKVRKNTAEKEIGSAEEEAKRIVSEAIKTGEAKKKEAVEKAIDVLYVDTEDPEGLDGARLALEKLIQPAKKEGTGLYYLLNDNNMITQDVINNFLSKPFNSLDDCGIISLIHKFPSGENWQPSGPIID